MKTYISTLEVSGALLQGENPLPVFRDATKNRNLKTDGTFTPQQLDHFGYETGFRVLPYKIQDRYSRERKTIQLKTVILENENLRAEFLADYGGRLNSLVDKNTGKELLFKNPVFQPANLSIRNAWFSGGIEWNVGQFGHCLLTCEPLFFARCKDKDGNEFLRVYEYERCKRVFWQIDFHLPQGAKVLYAYVRIINDNPSPVPIYWWTNIAVREEKNIRVFSGADEVIYAHPQDADSKSPDGHSFGVARMQELSSLPGRDASYPLNFPYSSEYFFQTPDGVESAWEAAAYDDGFMFFERSTNRLLYRKMFCWGNHPGGKHWKNFLSSEGEGDYIEIQAGMARTQMHGLDMPAETAWDFTQAFGSTVVPETARVYDADWFHARDVVLDHISLALTEEKLLQAHQHWKEYADAVPVDILHAGSGWGALEGERRQRTGDNGVPPGLIFPRHTMGKEQEPWLELLLNGKMKELGAPDGTHEGTKWGVQDIPASWMVDSNWLRILEDSIKDPENRNSTSMLHLGVMLYENGYRTEGVAAWEAVAEQYPSPLVFRNLAIAKIRAAEALADDASADSARDHTDAALQYMRKAFEYEQCKIDKAFAEEYLGLLIKTGGYLEAWDLFNSLPEHVKNMERIQILAGSAAIEVGEDEFLEKLFKREFALVREGESTVYGLWYRYQADKLAKSRGVCSDDRLLEEVKLTMDPPVNIDTRPIGRRK